MPITEIVRVLVSGSVGDARLDLYYDVDGAMGADEEATSRPWFWLRLRRGGAAPQVLGPFSDEPEALERAEALGVTWD